MEDLSSDLWTGVLSFLSTPELCVPCFTSKSLRDAACHLLDSRVRNISHWWYRRKVLPVEDRQVVEWWLSNVRDPTKSEVREAARRDDLETINLLGWDNTRYSTHKRDVSGFNDDCHSWDWQDILAESIAYGCKRLINACHKRGDPMLYELSFVRVCEEGNLEMIQWMLNNKEVEGLPSINNLSASFNSVNMVRKLGKRGHREVIYWLLESGFVHEWRLKHLYEGAGEGGRMDVIAWLEEEGVPFDSSCSDIHYFVTSLSILKWAKKHNIVVERAYEFALRIDQPEVMKYCFENGMGLPEHPFIELSIKHENTKALQLAIDHQFLTKETNITFDIESGNLKMIKYLHDRDLLQLEVSKYINDLDYYDVLQWAIDKDYPAGKLDDRNFFLKVSPEVIEWMIEKYGEDEKVFDQLVLDVFDDLGDETN
ncbi:hypothetical protein PROFUN_00626 [Planoprotostelium fungivorum]|uniref:Uncharacterized protein n=1 Tax=Planoprotostelium fungivorum TaxID=1890364 RepID=A0A2P6NTW3_9EUKA|nr:hypothetical protein PROFUN_00626 [Planoprotostelium fungivorum]